MSCLLYVFFQGEDGIRDLVRSRGLGDVYKRQEAHTGSLLLDEIGDMPIALQVKLLRALEAREIRAVGSTKTIPIDVRIISASHKDLNQAKADGTFREDLFYRLNVVTLRLPALRERREDIPLLLAHFLQRLSVRYGKNVTAFSPEALEMLKANAEDLARAQGTATLLQAKETAGDVAKIKAQLIDDSKQLQDFRKATIKALDEAKAGLSDLGNKADKAAKDLEALKVEVGSNTVVDSLFGVPTKQVFNDSCPSPLFIPTNTSTEWSSFYLTTDPNRHTSAVACATVCTYDNYVRSSYSCNCDIKGANCQTCYKNSWAFP